MLLRDRVVGTRCIAHGPADAGRFRILSVVDDYTRESLCLVPDTSLPSVRVIRELEAVVARRGLPQQCVSDNGPEFTGLAILRCPGA